MNQKTTIPSHHMILNTTLIPDVLAGKEQKVFLPIYCDFSGPVDRASLIPIPTESLTTINWLPPVASTIENIRFSIEGESVSAQRVHREQAKLVRHQLWSGNWSQASSSAVQLAPQIKSSASRQAEVQAGGFQLRGEVWARQSYALGLWQQTPPAPDKHHSHQVKERRLE